MLKCKNILHKCKKYLHLYKKSLSFTLFFLLPFQSFCAMYNIVEKDIIEAFTEYGETEEWENDIKEMQKKGLNEIYSMKGEQLPSASEDYSYETMYVYTLEEDIPRVDKFGNVTGIMYPKGFQFEPLKYMKLEPAPMIIFNSCNLGEAIRVGELRKELRPDTMLVTSGCELKNDFYVFGEEQFYHLDKKMINMFKLKNTISVVSVDLKKGVFNVKVYKPKTENEIKAFMEQHRKRK